MLALLIIAIPTTLAQIPELDIDVSSAENALSGAIDILGVDTIEFILAFGIIFAIIYMGFNLSNQISDNAGAKAAVSVISALSGLGAAFYIHTANIDFLGFVGTFGIAIAALAAVFLILKFVRDITGGKSLKDLFKDFTGGYLAGGLFVIGMGLTYIGIEEGAWLMGLGFIIFILIVLHHAIKWGWKAVASHPGERPSNFTPGGAALKPETPPELDRALNLLGGS